MLAALSLFPTVMFLSAYSCEGEATLAPIFTVISPFVIAILGLCAGRKGHDAFGSFAGVLGVVAGWLSLSFFEELVPESIWFARLLSVGYWVGCFVIYFKCYKWNSDD